MSLAVIVVAAGRGERLGHTRPKAFVDLAGKTLLEHALGTLGDLLDELVVVVVAPSAWVGAAEDLGRRALAARHSLSVVEGGSTRSDSVRAGLRALPPEVDTVLIHDAARALCPADVFTRVIESLTSGRVAVVPVLKVVDTVSPMDPETGVTEAAVDRTKLAIIQTPQGFRRDVIVSAHDSFPEHATDDADIARRAGHAVGSVRGDPRAFKITHADDLERARGLVSERVELRTGIGVDIHAYDPESPLWLGGVHWPGEPGLSGHSDGDVVIHAICDALLQAASRGDMGTVFGEARPEFEGAHSLVFLDLVLAELASHGFHPRSVSCQIVANTPRFSPRREEISQALSTIMGAPVHVAATTSDGLGLTGRGDGAAAFATALVAWHSGGMPSGK